MRRTKLRVSIFGENIALAATAEGAHELLMFFGAFMCASKAALDTMTIGLAQ